MSGAISPERFRLFIAIPVPEAIQSEMEKAQAELRRSVPGDAVRWARREQFHLTLKFLGNVESQQVEALSASLVEACRSFSPLRLRAGSIGFFPDDRNPRVIWVGVRDGKGLLPRLQAGIESAVAGFTAEAAEGKFTGHITLGRGKGLKRPEAERLKKLALSMSDRIFGEWTAEGVKLIRSELSAGGSRYSVVVTAPLLK